MMDKKDIFNNLTAWCAQSVSARRKALWIKHGGRLVDVSDAQFVFSQNVEDSDTKRLFDTEDYLVGCLTVLHASFIDACLKEQSAHKIPANKYILLPADFPKVVQSIGIPEDQASGDNAREPSPSTVQAVLRSRNRPPPTATRLDGNGGEVPLPGGEDDADNYRSVSGDGLASVPTGKRVASGSDIPQETATSKVQRRTEGEVREEPPDARDGRAKSDTSKKRSKGEALPWNLDISKIPHVKDLPKAAGAILDFVIGENGCKLYMVEDD